MGWRFALMCLTVGVGAVTRAQQPAAEQFTFRAEVAMVEVVAVVTGEGDRSLQDLTAADFQVLEDGEPRPLTTVRRLTTTHHARTGPPPAALASAYVEQLATNRDAADAPAFVLVLDDLNTSPYDTHRVIRAAEGALRFIPDDALVAVLTTSGIDGSLLTLSKPGPEHLQRIGKFRGQLLLAGPKGRSLGTETRPSSVNAPCGVGSGVLNSQNCGDPTRPARRASTIAAAAQILGRAGARRKVLFWITPDMGISPLDPAGNRRAQKQALLQAVNNDVAVYAVDPRENITGVEMSDDRPDRTSGGTYRVGGADTLFQGSGGGVLSLDTDDMVAVTLPQLARETGGRYITAANDLENVLGRVVEQNATSYLLAYESPVSRVLGYHSIDVRVLRAGTRVYARRGYVVSPPARGTASEMEGSLQARILRDTLMGSVSQGQLSLVVHVAPQFADGKQGRALVTVKLDNDGAHEGAVDLGLATIDEAGRVGNQRQVRMSSPSSGEPWEVTTELALTRGRYQLRVAGVTADARRRGLVIASVEIVEPGRDLVMTPLVLLDFTAGRVHPTAMRTFASGNPLGVQVEVGGRPVQQKSVTVRAALLDRTGRAVREAAAVLDPGAKPNRMRATAVLKTDGVAEGDYVLLTEAHASAADTAVRGAIPITLRRSSTGAGADIAATAANAVAPAEARNRVIPHTIVAHGPTSWHEKPVTLVIRTEQEWAAFWKRLPTRQSPPAIDFARVTLLAIVMETDSKGATEQPSVSRIEQNPDAAVVVYWETKTITHPSDEARERPLRPFIVVGLTERVGHVRFQRVGDP